jgi:hypothetical protein
MSAAQRTQVVVRYVEVLGLWYVCHARSYQNAIPATCNGRDTRRAAEILAGEYGFEVVLHLNDPAQYETPTPRRITNA